jgi:hypothetical protein
MFLIVLAKKQDWSTNQKIEEVKQTLLAIEELGVKKNNTWQLYQEDNRLEQRQRMLT